MFLRQVGIGEKYIQQDEPDQELAFRKAMTFELALAGIVLVAGIALVPALAAIFDEPAIIAPALVSLLVVPAQALQAPLWIFYRDMDFVRQRKLQILDPVTGFVIAVALLIAGWNYWSLIVGVVAGAWVGALVSLRASPYRFRWSWDRATLRSYASFSWPLFFAGMSGIVVGQGLLIVGEAELGLAGVGIIALASTISQYSDRADQAITQTIYPTICAVKDRADLLYEAFVKSNRLALMWGAPFGLGPRAVRRGPRAVRHRRALARRGSGSCRRSASRSPCTRSASTGTPSTAREPTRSRSRSPRRSRSSRSSRSGCRCWRPRACAAWRSRRCSSRA